MRRRGSRRNDDPAYGDEDDGGETYEEDDDGRREGADDDDDEDEEDDEPPPPSKRRAPVSTPRKSKVKGEPTACGQLCTLVNDRLKGLAQKVCAALQKQLPVGSTRSIFDIQFVLHTGIEELETQHFPLSITVSLEQGSSDVTRGPVPLITGSKPTLAGLLKSTTVGDTKARAFIFKVIAEWFYKCWERIAANEKLGVSPGRTFVALMKTTPPVPGGLHFDLRLGEWVGDGVSVFADEPLVTYPSTSTSPPPAPEEPKVNTTQATGQKAPESPKPVQEPPAATPTLAKPVLCAQGHLIVPMSKPALIAESKSYTEGYQCVACNTKSELKDAEILGHCATCSHDLCPKCYAEKKKS
ncbi:hypothetical protein Pelo_12407 [Pelomyxa schiedti]|nr:hypothetical protein Pelo_12407 [Pelomyxa schiedti]